jgi:hypothetical protein
MILPSKSESPIAFVLAVIIKVVANGLTVRANTLAIEGNASKILSLESGITGGSVSSRLTAVEKDIADDKLIISSNTTKIATNTKDIKTNTDPNQAF